MDFFILLLVKMLLIILFACFKLNVLLLKAMAISFPILFAILRKSDIYFCRKRLKSWNYLYGEQYRKKAKKNKQRGSKRQFQLSQSERSNIGKETICTFLSILFSPTIYPCPPYYFKKLGKGELLSLAKQLYIWIQVIT